MIKMRCRKVRQALSAYLDGALPAGKHESMAAHVEICRECRNILNQLQELKPLLTGLSIPPVPAGMTAQVAARAKERLERRGKPCPALPWALFRWWTLETPAMRLAAAAILAIGLIAGFFLGRSTSTIPVRFAFPASARQNRQPDPMAFYGFDSLFSDTAGSIEQAYLAMSFNPGPAHAGKEG